MGCSVCGSPHAVPTSTTVFLYPSCSPDRLLLHLFQVIASSVLLDLNYLVLYRSFASNFSWAIYLFGSTSGSPI